MKAKKLLAGLLSATMVLSAMALPAFAADTKVAKTGDVEYTTLAEAFEAAADGSTVTLLDDVTLTETITLNNTKAITLNTAGKTITCKATYGSIDLDGSSLNIIGKGKITSSYTEDKAQRAINVESANSTLTVDGVTVTTDNGFIAATDGGKVVINGGKYNITKGGAALFAYGENTEVKINGGSFTGTDVSEGAVYAFNNANVTVNGGNFNFSDDETDYTSYGVEKGTSVNWLFCDYSEMPSYPYNYGDVSVTCGGHISVKGGTYNKDISALANFKWGDDNFYAQTINYLADGVEIVQRGDKYVVNPAAKIDDDYYGTVGEAIAAAREGDTITLVRDVTEPDYKGAAITHNLTSKTLDLNKFTYSLNNFSHIFEGTGGAIKNGAMVGLDNASYALFIGDSLATTSFTVENVEFTGGINVYNATGVVLKDSVSAAATNYYAVWADEGAEVTIEGGEYRANTRAVLGATSFTYENVVYSSIIDVKGGKFICGNNNVFLKDKEGELTVSGGTFDRDVSAYVADGYIAVKDGDNYVVKKSDIKVENEAQVVSTTVTLDGLESNLKVQGLLKDGEQAIYKTETSVPSAKDQKAAVEKAGEKKENTTREMYDIKVVKYVSGEVANADVPVKNQKVVLTLGAPVKEDASVKITHVKTNGTAETISGDKVTVSGNTVSFTASSFSTFLVDYESAEVPEADIAENIDVSFDNMVTDGKTATFDLVINGADSKVINRFTSSEWTFNLTDGFAYEIAPKDHVNIIENTADSTYEFNMDSKTYSDATGTKIALATVTVTGNGEFTFKADSAKVHATKSTDNIVTDFDSAADDTATTGKVNIDATATDTLATKKYDLNVNIAFNNAVENQAVAYQDMTATISGGDLTDNLVYKLGSDFDTSDTDVTLSYDNGYALKISNKLSENVAYTVKVEGAGYRTARYTVNMTGAKTLNFWNNVKDTAINVDESVTTESTKKNVTFLAGDIVKDNQINIYDLSAVVSYFGTNNLVDDHPEYAKYDLNRDGKIDSKDIAYVLVSWGN